MKSRLEFLNLPKYVEELAFEFSKSQNKVILRPRSLPAKSLALAIMKAANSFYNAERVLMPLQSPEFVLKIASKKHRRKIRRILKNRSKKIKREQKRARNLLESINKNNKNKVFQLRGTVETHTKPAKPLYIAKPI